jgi:hypothetical protein
MVVWPRSSLLTCRPSNQADQRGASTPERGVRSAPAQLVQHLLVGGSSGQHGDGG